LQAVCDALARTTGWIVIPQVVHSYGAILEQFARNHVHVAWAPPLVALELERGRTARVALCSTRSGRTVYHCALFVRRASPIRTLEHLTGRHVAWVDVESCAGYVVPRLRILAEGLDPSTLFGRESFHHTHQAVAQAVLSGAADVGATYLSADPRSWHAASAGWFEAGAAPDAVRVLATAGPIPSDAIVVSTKLPSEILEALPAALQRLARTVPEDLRHLLRADGLQAPPAGHFDELRRLMREASTRSGSRPAIDVDAAEVARRSRDFGTR